MKKSRFLQIVSLIFSMLLMLNFAIGCNKTNVEESKPISYRLNKTVATLNIGESMLLEVSPSPTESLAWESNDVNIATVEEGVVYGISAGMTTIDVQVGEETLSCVVSVQNDVEINKSISLDTTEIYLSKGSVYRLTATLTENGQEVAEKINWQIISGDTENITFSPIGYGKQCEIVVKQEGIFVIQASDVSGNVSAICKVKVVTEHFNRLPYPNNFQSTGEIIAWDQVENADGYVYSLDGQEEQFTASNSVNIKEYLDENKVAVLTVRSKGNELTTVDSYPTTTIVYAQLHLFKVSENQCAWYKAGDAERYLVCNKKGATLATIEANAFVGNVMYYDFAAKVDYAAITVKAVDANGAILKESEPYQQYYSVFSCIDEKYAEENLIARYSYNDSNLEKGYRQNVALGGRSGDFAYYTSQSLVTGNQVDAMSFNVKMQYTKEQLITLKLLGYTKILIPVYVDYEGVTLYDENGELIGETSYDINKNREYAYFNNANIGAVDNTAIKFKTWDNIEVDLQSYIDNYEKIVSDEYFLYMNYHYSNVKGSERYNPLKLTIYFDDIYIK